MKGSVHSRSSPTAAGITPIHRTPKCQRLLTDRELEVLQCLPTRLSTLEIGRRLRISPNTVKTHLKNIYRKLGARSRNEAILRGAQLHLLSSDSATLVTL
jgi:DNA-binding CsgD family transcriptional regulator